MLGEGEKMELSGPRRKRRDTKEEEFGPGFGASRKLQTYLGAPRVYSLWGLGGGSETEGAS